MPTNPQELQRKTAAVKQTKDEVAAKERKRATDHTAAQVRKLRRNSHKLIAHIDEQLRTAAEAELTRCTVDVEQVCRDLVSVGDNTAVRTIADELAKRYQANGWARGTAEGSGARCWVQVGVEPVRYSDDTQPIDTFYCYIHFAW